MWVAKFQFDGSNILYGKTAKKFNGTVIGNYLFVYEKNKVPYVTSYGRFIGKEENRKKAIKFLKKDKHVISIEESKDFFLILVKEDKNFKSFYSPAFFHLSPTNISNQGIYTFHIASWNRKDIESLLKNAEKYPGFKLISLKQEKIQNMVVTSVLPNLTEKQKQVYDLAVEKGYYDYPKKIELKQLAKILNISYSTFQQHLKYAEKKISQHITGRYNTDYNR